MSLLTKMSGVGAVLLVVAAAATYVAVQPQGPKPGTKPGRDNRIILLVHFNPPQRATAVHITTEDNEAPPVDESITELPTPQGWVVTYRVSPTRKILLVATQVDAGTLGCSINWVANGARISDSVRVGPGPVKCHYP